MTVDVDDTMKKNIISEIKNNALKRYVTFARDLFRHQNRWILIVILLGILLGVSSLNKIYQSFSYPYLYRKDIVQEYLLARAVMADENPYQPLPILYARFIDAPNPGILSHPTPHPPSIIPLVLWMGLMDYETVALLWFCLELISLLGISFLASAELNLKPRWFWCGIIVLFLVGWFPVTLDLLYAQLMVILALLLYFALRLLCDRRSWLAGVIVGLTIAIKLFAWPLCLLFVIKRNWRALFASVLCFSVLSGFGFLLIGSENFFFYYFDVSREVSSLYRSCTYSYSLATLGWRLFSGTQCETIVGLTASPLLHLPSLAPYVSWIIPALFLLLVLVVIIRSVHSLEISFCLMLCASVLISPVFWNHYLVIGLIPVVVIAKNLQRRQDVFARRVRLVLLLLISLSFLPESTLSRFLGVFGTTQGVRYAGEVSLSFPIGLMTLLPVVLVVMLMWLLWLVHRRNTVV